MVLLIGKCASGRGIRWRKDSDFRVRRPQEVAGGRNRKCVDKVACYEARLWATVPQKCRSGTVRQKTRHQEGRTYRTYPEHFVDGKCEHRLAGECNDEAERNCYQ